MSCVVNKCTFNHYGNCHITEGLECKYAMKCNKCQKMGIWIHTIIGLCENCIQELTDCNHCDPDYCENKYENCFMIKDWFSKKRSTLTRFL